MMFRGVWRSLKIIFVVLRAVRLGITAVVFVIGAAILIMPPTLKEQDMLAIPADTSPRDDRLLMNRMAKLIAYFESDALYGAMAAADQNGMEADDFRLVIKGFAEGHVRVPEGANVLADIVEDAADPAAPSQRMTQGEREEMMAQLQALVDGRAQSYRGLIESEGRPLGPDDDIFPTVDTAPRVTLPSTRTGGAKFVSAPTE